MEQRYRRLPSMSALRAFESAARHGSFSRAADELATSQPAVSRHVLGLEADLGTALFTRNGNRIALSSDGRRLFHAVVAGLDEIGRAVDDLRRAPQRKAVTIGCSYDVAHLWLMPRHGGLQEGLGSDVDIRILTSDYELHDTGPEDGVDVRLTYLHPLPDGTRSVLLFEEEVFPVCAPDAVDAVADLPHLHLSKRNFGWASWERWFALMGRDAPTQHSRDRRFSSYVYLLEAAVDGAGLALGWTGLVDRYLEQGRLVRTTEGTCRPGGAFRAVLAREGQASPYAETAVDYLTGR